MLKIKNKKKPSKNSNNAKPQPVAKTPAPKPEWNSTQSDLDRYRLSQAELVQKKVALMSKHKYEAKELWLKRQEKLKKGILDEETQSVMETCLSTKRQPEKNKKNLTYFIKDENYESREDSEELQNENKMQDHLSLLDLQNENEPKEKYIGKRDNYAEKPQGKADAENQGDDFLKRVNQSLKDAREFIGKIERYPSINKGKDPEKTLNALQSLPKENKPRTSSVPKSKNSKPITNSKAPLRNSQQNLNKDTDIKIEGSNLISKTDDRHQYQAEERELDYEEPKKDDNEDISQYFKSLNQIEDTIKFLEENIMGIKSDQTEEKKQITFEPKKLDRNELSPSNKAFTMENTSPLSTKFNIDNKYFGERENIFNLQESKPERFEQEHDYFKDKSFEKEINHEDEQISFDLTMRSDEQTDRYDYKMENSFRANGQNHRNAAEDTLKRSIGISDQNSRTVSFPQVIFENKSLYERSENQPSRNLNTQNTIPSKKSPQKELDEDEDEFNIDRIKSLLQMTKSEIEKMNTGHVDAYNTSFKNFTDHKEKENISSNFEPLIQKGPSSFKNEVTIQVKQPFNPGWDNQRKVLSEISNKKDFLDDIPAPETLNIKKHLVNYSPKKTEDNSLSIRSFRKK